VDHMPRRQSSQPLGMPSPVEFAQLMNRVQAVSNKAETLLATVGRGHKEGSALMRFTSGSRSQERIALLSERLSHLEALLDEVNSSGVLRQTLSYKAEQVQPSIVEPTTPLWAHKGGGAHTASTPYPLHPPPRFIEVTPPQTHRQVAPTPPTPMPPSGVRSPGFPPPPSVHRAYSSTWTSSAPPPLTQSTFTPRAAGLLSAGGPVRLSMPPTEVVPRAVSLDLAIPPPRPPPVVSVNLVTPAPTYSHAPMAVQPVPQPPQRLPSAPILPVGVRPPKSASFRSDPGGVEGKLHQWLATIPIGNGAERGWDNAQVAEIALFAEDQHIEHLPAEEIYKRYVEYQVERAG